MSLTPRRSSRGGRGPCKAGSASLPAAVCWSAGFGV